MKTKATKEKAQEKLQQEIMEKLKGLSVKEAKSIVFGTLTLIDNNTKIT